MDEDRLAAVQARVNRFGNTSDCLEALADAGMRDARALLASVPELGTSRRQRFEIDALAEDDDERLPRVMVVASLHEQRATRTGEAADVDDARFLVDAVLVDTPADHPARPSRLNGRALYLRLRAELTADPRAIDEAIVAGLVIQSTHPLHPVHRLARLTRKSARITSRRNVNRLNALRAPLYEWPRSLGRPVVRRPPPE